MIAEGADALKLFPAEGALPQVLRAVRAILPADVSILPVGDIARESFAGCWKAGAQGFRIGSALYRAGDAPASARQRVGARVAVMRALIGRQTLR